jgi:hypothetical protein
MNHNYAVSILLPTRGRTDALRRSVQSLVDTVADPESVEILFGFDEDDVASSSWFIDELAPELDQAGITYTQMEFEPMGYVRLNEYVNALAAAAAGRWLMFWNDDAVMETSGWDREIIQHDGHFRVLRMPTHRDHPYAIFPIVPREWHALFGYVSAHQISDAWVSQIAYMLDIMHNIDVKVTHDRHDLTGNNDDSTYKQRVMLEGRPSDPRDFNHISWRRRRMQDALTICKSLESQGQTMTWFRSVMDGTQDPWAKMTSQEYDPNRQLAVFK